MFLVYLRNFMDSFFNNSFNYSLTSIDFYKTAIFILLAKIKNYFLYIISFRWFLNITYIKNQLPSINDELYIPIVRDFFHFNSLIAYIYNISLTQIFSICSFSAVHVYFIKRLYSENITSIIPVLTGYFISEILFIVCIYYGMTHLFIILANWERFLIIAGIIFFFYEGVNFIKEDKNKSIYLKIPFIKHSIFINSDQFFNIKEFLLGVFLFCLDSSSIFTLLSNLSLTPTVSNFEFFINSSLVQLILFILIRSFFFYLSFIKIYPYILNKIKNNTYFRTDTLKKINIFIQKGFGMLLIFFSISSIPFYTIEYLLGYLLGIIPKDISLFFTQLDPYFLSDSPGFYEQFYYGNTVVPFKVAKFDRGRYLLYPAYRELPPSYEDFIFKPIYLEWTKTLKSNNYIDRYLGSQKTTMEYIQLKATPIIKFFENLFPDANVRKSNKRKKILTQLLTDNFLGSHTKLNAYFNVPYAEKLLFFNRLSKSAFRINNKKYYNDLILSSIEEFVTFNENLIPNFETLTPFDKCTYRFSLSNNLVASRLKPFVDFLDLFSAPEFDITPTYVKIAENILSTYDRKKFFAPLADYFKNEKLKEFEVKKKKTQPSLSREIEAIHGKIPLESIITEGIVALFPEWAYIKMELVGKLGSVIKEYQRYFNFLEIFNLYLRGHSFKLTVKQTIDLHYRQLYQTEAISYLRHYFNNNHHRKIRYDLDNFSKLLKTNFIGNTKIKNLNTREDSKKLLISLEKDPKKFMKYLLFKTTRSFANKVYNHQFKGTLVDIMQWFSYSPYTSSMFREINTKEMENIFIEAEEPSYLLSLSNDVKKYYPIIKYDQAFYKENALDKGIIFDHILFKSLIEELYDSLNLESSGLFKNDNNLNKKNLSLINSNLISPNQNIFDLLNMIIDYITITNYSLSKIDTLLNPFMEYMSFEPLCASNHNNLFVLSTAHYSINEVDLPVKTHNSNKWPLPSNILDYLVYNISENKVSFRNPLSYIGMFLQIPYEKFGIDYKNTYIFKVDNDEVLNEHEVFDQYMDFFARYEDPAYESLQLKFIDLFLEKNLDYKNKALCKNYLFSKNFMVPTAYIDCPFPILQHFYLAKNLRQLFFARSPIRGGYQWAGSYHNNIANNKIYNDILKIYNKIYNDILKIYNKIIILSYRAYQFINLKKSSWDFSSAGRVAALQADCHRFESGKTHIKDSPFLFFYKK